MYPGELGRCWRLASSISPQTCLLAPGEPGDCWGNLGRTDSPPPPPDPASFLHSPACRRTWGPARTRGCEGWHWAQFLRLCLCPGGTWISRTPSCGRERGGEQSRLRAPRGGGLDAPRLGVSPFPILPPPPAHRTPHHTELALPRPPLGCPMSTSATHPQRADKAL